MAVEGEIPLDLAPHIASRELVHSRDVLEQQRSRAKLFEDRHELPVEVIAGISEQPIVIMDLTEGLAWWATRKEIELASSRGRKDRLMVAGIGQVTLYHLRIWVIQTIRRASIRIMISGSQDREPSLPQSLAEAACPTEKIDS